MPPVHGDGPPGGPQGGNSGGFMGGSSSATATPTATTATPASPSTSTPSPSSASHNSTSTTTSPKTTTATPTATTATPTSSSSSTTSSSNSATTASSGSTTSSTTITSNSTSSSSTSASSSTNDATTESSSKTSSKSWEVPVVIGGAVALVAVAVIFVYMRSAKRHRDEKRVSTPPPLRAGGGGGGYRQQTTMRGTYDGLLLSPSSRSLPNVPATAILQEGRSRKGSKQLKQPTIANRPLTPSSEIATVTEPSLIHQAKYTISGEHYEGDSIVDTSRDNRVTGISEWSTDSQEYMGQHNPPPSFYANLDPRESEYSPVYSTFSRDTGSEYGMSQRFDSEIIPVSEPGLDVSNRQTGAEFHDSQHDTRRINAGLKPAERLKISEFNF